MELQRRTFLQLMALLLTFLPTIENEPTTEIPVEPPIIVEPKKTLVKLHIGDRTFKLANLTVDFSQDVEPMDFGTGFVSYVPRFRTAELYCVSTKPLSDKQKEYIISNVNEIVIENVSGKGYFDWYAFDQPTSTYFLDDESFVIQNNGYGRIL